MQTDKIKELEKLLSEKKTDEAKALIKGIVLEKMTPEEKGESLVNIASMYLDIMNKIDRQYEQALKDALTGLKDLDNRESKAKDEESLRKVRESLQ